MCIQITPKSPVGLVFLIEISIKTGHITVLHLWIYKFLLICNLFCIVKSCEILIWYRKFWFINGPLITCKNPQTSLGLNKMTIPFSDKKVIWCKHYRQKYPLTDVNYGLFLSLWHIDLPSLIVLIRISVKIHYTGIYSFICSIWVKTVFKYLNYIKSDTVWNIANIQSII